MATAVFPKITYVTLFADESIHPKYEAALKKFEETLGKRYPMYIGEDEVWSEEGEFVHSSPIDTSIKVARFQVGTKSHAKACDQRCQRSVPKVEPKKLARTSQDHE